MIVSDGRYKGTQHPDGQKLITRLTTRSSPPLPGKSGYSTWTRWISTAFAQVAGSLRAGTWMS